MAFVASAQYTCRKRAQAFSHKLAIFLGETIQFDGKKDVASPPEEEVVQGRNCVHKIRRCRLKKNIISKR